MSRLEEIKEEYKGFIEMENDENYEESLEIAMWLVDGHLHWLIKQAERVEELEEFAKMLIGEEELHQRGEYGTEFNRLFQLNNRYKQALEEIFNYALSFSHIEDLDESNYELFEFAQNVSNTIQGTLETDKT